MIWAANAPWLVLLLLIGAMILCFALLPLLIEALANRLSRKRADSRVKLIDQAAGLALLQQRHARGEIDAVTFEQMRERLEAWDSNQQSSQDQPLARTRQTSLLPHDKTFANK
jgi:hypothetical protein